MRGEQVVELARPVGVAERAADLGEQRQRDQPVGVARQRVEARARDHLEHLARALRPAELDVHQRLRAAPGGDRRVHLDEARDRILDLAEPALLAADVEHRHRVVVHGVLGMAALADRERLAGQPLGLRELSGELRTRAAEQRRPPQVQRAVHHGGERGRGLDLHVGAGDVAELEQVDDGPAGALQLELEVANLRGDPPQLRGDLQALLDVLGPPQHVVARVERGGQRRRVADAARERDRLLAERHPPLGLARVVELERQAGEQPSAQRRVLLAERGERLLEHRDDGRVLAAQGRPRPSGAERRAGEQQRVVELARDVDRGGERRARLLEPRARLGGAEREQQLAARAVARRARGLARPQRAAVVLGRLLPREPSIGLAPRGERVVDRARGPVDRRRSGEVARELRQPRAEVVLMAQEDRLADARVQPGAPQAREAVVERRADQRVREGVAPDAAVDLAQHPRHDRRVERRDQLVARQRPECLEQPEVELAADHARDLHCLARRGGQARRSAAT